MPQGTLRCKEERGATFKWKAMDEAMAFWGAEKVVFLAKAQKEFHKALSKCAAKREPQFNAAVDESITNCK